MHRPLQLDVSKGIGRITWPMGLTFLRLLLLPVFLYLLLADDPIDPLHHPARHAALVVFAVMAVTDKLDGYLARKLNQASKLGALLDPVADKLLVLATIVVMSFPGIAGVGAIPKLVVIVLYGKDVLLAMGTLYVLSRRGRITVSARLAGKVSTVVQLALVMASLLAVDVQRMSPAFVAWAIPFLSWATIATAVIASLDYAIVGWKLLRTTDK